VEPEIVAPDVVALPAETATEEETA
jgi:hypothetical protein